MKFKKYLPMALPIGLIVVANLIYFFQKQKNSQQDVQTLIVYTYSSFASSWGAGPELAKIFKQKTNATLEFVDAGEAGVLLQRLTLEGRKTKADLVLGLDQYTIEDFELNGKKNPVDFISIDITLEPDHLVPAGHLNLKKWIAYDWSPLSFIYRKSNSKTNPSGLFEFISPQFKSKIILLDPRTSSPGYIFYNWIVQSLGVSGARSFIEKMRPHVFAVTPSWSAGYGLFKDEQSDYIFSFITSPLYHWIEEKNEDYQALSLKEPLPFQVEYIGVLDSSQQKDLAVKFVKFLISKEAQKIIMTKNYMLPITKGVREGTPFEKIKDVRLFESSNKISKQEVLKSWKSIQW